MARPPFKLTGVERRFGDEEIIVNKTDRRGIITYANEVFMRVSQYSEEELLGKPHNLVRHPDMPRCVFKYLWDTIEAGKEVFAFVMNRTKSGDHYWVLAHVTPTFDTEGRILSYHSNRRSPNRAVLPKVQEFYKLLRNEEAKHSSPRNGMAAGLGLLVAFLEKERASYEEFVFSLV